MDTDVDKQVGCGDICRGSGTQEWRYHGLVGVIWHSKHSLPGCV